jgi:PAS domain S-box-containing protein
MNKKLFVLVIENSPTDAEQNVRLLRSAGYDISYQRVETAEELTEALEFEPWDLILSEYSMPRFTVQQALEIYHAHGSDIPFIVISGAIGQVKAVQIIKAGAHDYLLKANLTRFIPVVERELRQALNRRDLVKVSSESVHSEQKHRNCVEHAPDVVFVSDRAGNYIEVNEAASRITGYTREELLKMSVMDLVIAESQEKRYELFSKLLETGSLNADFEVWHKNGSKRWFAVDAIQLSETRFLGFIKDITDRKLATIEVMQNSDRVFPVTLSESDRSIDYMGLASGDYVA